MKKLLSSVFLYFVFQTPVQSADKIRITTPADGFRRLVEDTKTITKVDRDVSISEVADLSILREAQREMGIR